MNNQFSFSKEIAVGFYFPRSFNYLFFFFWRQFRQIINKIPGVGRIWNYKPELKPILPENLAFKIMFLYHFHILYGLISNAKSQSEAYCFQFQKLRPQVVPDDSSVWIIFVTQCEVYLLCWNIN